MKTYPEKVWRREMPPIKVDLSLAGRTVEAAGLWPLLEAIEAPGFLTADHAALLLFSECQRSTKAASGRLRRLMALGLVDAFRFGRHNQGRGGSAPLIYCLTRPGGQLLAAHRGVKLDTIKFHDRDAGVLNTYTISHRLNIADFHVALASHSRAHQEGIKRFQYEPRWQLERGVHLSPDALAELENGLALMVEIDRNTERPRRFAERCVRYEQFVRSGLWERWLAEPPTVLVVVAAGGEDRVAELRAATARTLVDGEHVFQRYRFTSMEWLYQVERSVRGYAPPVHTRFDRAVTIPPLDDEWVPVIGRRDAE